MAAPPNYLTLTAIVKNEGRYIEEWIEFHCIVGVKKFIIYDNGSTDDTTEKLQPYVSSGLVTLIPWQHFDVMRSTQPSAYAHALANFGHLTAWMGFFDLDEFVFATDGTPLDQFLMEFEDLPALGVAGVYYSSSGYQSPPNGLVIENYRHGVPFHLQIANPSLLLQVKSFVQPKFVATSGIHYCGLKNSNVRFYTEKRIPITNHIKRTASLQSIDTIRYNHYYAKSKEDFWNKCARGNAGHLSFTRRPGSKVLKKSELIDALASEDRSILLFADQLRARFVCHDDSPSRIGVRSTA